MSYKKNTSVFGYPMPGADTRAELKAILGPSAGDVYQLADGSTWRFSPTATAVEDTLQAFVLTPTDARFATAGRWLRADYAFDLSIPVSFANTDAQVLETLPAGVELRWGRAYQNVTTAWTGGASSAIGVSSSNAAYSTKGDLEGGASGDLLAALTVGKGRGTVGAKVASGGVVVLVGGDAIRFDRIVSAYTAGAGVIVAPVHLVANAGALGAP